MKIGNREAIIILVSAIVLISVASYIAKAATVAYSSGYMILLDRDPDEKYLTLNNYSTIIFLPNDNCEGFANVCSFDWPAGVDTRADITKDGRVDYADITLYQAGFGCTDKFYNGSANPCWEESFNLQECYFTYNGGSYKDPSGDCYINGTDMTILQSAYGATGVSYGNANYSADLNKDGKVDLKDMVLAAINYGKYSDTFKDYACIKKKDLDINGPNSLPDGKIDLRDIIIVAKSFNQKAAVKNCISQPLMKLGNGRYRVTAGGYGMYSIGASFRCYML